MERARRFLVWLIVAVFERLGVDLNPPDLNFTIGPVTNAHDAQGVPMTIVLTNEQKVLIAINPRTAAGNPAPLDGNPMFTSSDESVITIEPTDDPNRVFVVAQAAGSATMNASADADMDEGEVRTLTGSIDFVVDQAEASDLGFVAGEPELK